MTRIPLKPAFCPPFAPSLKHGGGSTSPTFSTGVGVSALSKAAVAGVVRPPTDDPELKDPDTWPRQLEDQEARRETRFKVQRAKGSLFQSATALPATPSPRKFLPVLRRRKKLLRTPGLPSDCSSTVIRKTTPVCYGPGPTKAPKNSKNFFSRHQDIKSFNRFCSALAP